MGFRTIPPPRRIKPNLLAKSPREASEPLGPFRKCHPVPLRAPVRASSQGKICQKFVEGF